MQYAQDMAFFSPVSRKKHKRCHRRRRKDASIVAVLESFNQLPLIYGPSCLNLSPKHKRPVTNQSRSKSRSTKNQVSRYETRPELQTLHKVSCKQNYLSNLPPIPQISEEQIDKRDVVKNHRIYRSINKQSLSPESIDFKTPMRGVSFESGDKDSELSHTRLTNGTYTPQQISRMQRKRRIKTINSGSIQPAALQTVQPEIEYHQTEFSKKYSIERVSVIRQLLTKSIRSEIFRINLPQKLEDIEPFIENYKPINPDVLCVKESPNYAVIPYKSLKALYFGEAKDKMRHGLGVYLCQNHIFQGKFQNDNKVMGLETTPQGVYKGEFSNGKRNGTGQFEWYNGQSYRGQWRENQKHGYGVWLKPNGQSYSGQWKQNTISGNGRYCFNSQHSYDGQWLNFSKSGKGIEKFENGHTYQGDYLAGLPHGHGKYTWNADEYYEGQWVNGYREGIGTHLKKRHFKYHGQYLKDRRHGCGELEVNNTTYSGTFEADVYKGPIKVLSTTEESVVCSKVA